ncbi:MAG: thioredoxin family protein [Staphylococcus sp.]|nr:thioredoxin family protein [Staphylococcus sp.]
MKILTNENYKEEVLDYKGKVAVDFYATWCGPCKMIKPQFESMEEEYKDFKFCEADVDVCSNFAEEMKISNVPTFIVFENGKVIEHGGIDKFIDFMSNYL